VPEDDIDIKRWNAYSQRMSEEGQRSAVADLGSGSLDERLEETNRAHRVLAESETILRSLFMNLGAASCLDEIVYRDGRAVDYRVLDVNPAFERITGIARERAVGALGSALYGKEQPPFLDVYARVAETGKPESFEAYFEPLGLHLHITASCPLKGMFSTVFFDITDRRRAEAEYRAVFNATSDAIFIDDAATGRILDVNEPMLAMYGFESKDEALQCNIGDLSANRPPYTDAEAQERVKAAAGGVPQQFEWVAKRTDGSEFPVEVTLRAFSVEGQPRVLAVVRDITSRKKAQEKLAQNASLLRMAGRLSRLGGWSVNLAEMTCVWSDEVAAIHEVPPGYSPPVEDGINFYAPEWKERITEVFTACAREGIPYDEEMEILTARGRRVWVRTVGEPIRDRSGAITTVQGAFQDITERKRAEEERRKLQQQVFQSQKMDSVGSLAGGVAHDFNNLLSVILNYTSFALDSLHEQDPLRADLVEVKKAGDRAAALTRQLLAFGRRQVLEPRVLNLNDVIRGLERMLQRILGEDVDLVWGLAPDLGMVTADPGQLEQVIMNLVVNARDAMPSGGQLRIESSNVNLDDSYAARHVGVSPGSYVVLAITDTGCGMDSATQERLFEPFFTTKEKGKGTGLGLPTAYGIVRQTGGTISVYSELRRGSTFKVYLPQLLGPRLERGTSVQDGVVRGGTETILVVEDDATVRRVAARMLGEEGYQVLTASSGGEAFLICEEHPGEVHLLLTDVVMPRMGGPELAERLRKLRPEMRVAFMSGYTEGTILHDGAEGSGTVFIAKPFERNVLKRKVREALDGADEKKAR
jgi:PAS domain S-box-containing protein